ncbi:family 10 glycosylhydrolase [Echinicola soli]|uniref:Family 10 glycosylhydrolase n=1 Tax=Echinicola soli TaxID=2591634 RepID=A0A514CEP8_9BACT|nr:family 10 glycosylhydrolase [Echinicola soli]QDH78293.1 family 10 glycosylhydrolase [Echinicola soli]
MKSTIWFYGIIALVLLMASCAGSKKVSKAPSPAPLPNDKAPEVPTVPDEKTVDAPQPETLPMFVAPEREMRGVWIATVANIDWPSSSTDSFEQQQRDFIQILDFYKQRNFNAVFVQIRAAGDAFYPSKLAPWSRYLTGKEGKEPATVIDPLKWMVQAVHERGMEFHAWLNPYRASFNLNVDELSPSHDYYRHPEWMVKYGTKLYYNPGLPAVREHLVEVVKEVTRNYDVDGIHFDDYFYPYKIKGVEFDDKSAFQKYSNSLSLADWRRTNVDQLIRNVSETIKDEKPWVQFGVSPFGVWRNASVDPRGSNTRAGHTNYDDLYADPLVWMKNGWVDYIAPQIYWSLDFPAASYKTLIKWWSDNAYNTKVYVGNASYKIRSDADESWNSSFEIPNQVALGRNIPGIKGNVFFRAKSMMGNNRDVANLLLQNNYINPVLTPALQVSSGVMRDLVPEVESSHLADRGLQLKITNAYLSEAVVLFGLSPSGKWELVESQRTSTSIDGETFAFDSFMIQNYQYLAVGFMGNYGELSQMNVWKP